MASRLGQLRERFQGTTQKTRRRRKDYLGKRLRLNLRVSEDIVRALDVLKVANGVDKNGFCEEAIRAAVAEQLTKLRASVREEEWGEIVRRAGHRE